MTRKLTAHVHVDNTWYGPGDPVPDEVAARITNPDAWDGPVSATSEAGDEGPASTEDRREDPPPAPKVRQPPRRGPGSGGPAWVEFAADNGVTEKFESKDALITHLEDAGLIEKE